MIVGLTGGIASGKSTVSSIFKDFGIKIVDADRVAKEISNKKINIEKIIDIFGKSILDEHNEIDRKKLRERAFEDKNLLNQLNNLVHPQVIEYFKEEKDCNNIKNIVIFDVPLLFESQIDKMCDKIIVVAVSKDVQVKRIIKRDNSSEKLALKIIESQLPLEYKIEHADFVIYNDATIEDLKTKVKEVYNVLEENVR